MIETFVSLAEIFAARMTLQQIKPSFLQEANQMHEIILDEEFRCLLPALDNETYRLLEENLLEHGCRDPLVLWNGILIDGYNRYKICTEHNIPFNTIDKEFDSREEVLIWIITNQVSRRNLTPIQLSHFRGLHYKADKKIKGTSNQYVKQSEKSQNATFHSGSTANRLAQSYRVSRDTILRDSKLSEAISLIGETSPEAKGKILSGEVAISKTKLEALPLASKEEVEALVVGIVEGTHKRRAPRNPADIDSLSILPEIRQLNAVIRDFASNFNSMFHKLNNGGTMELKSVLRSYINQLEDLYRNIQ